MSDIQSSESKTTQECLLKMMEFFHSFCVENNLRYYMVGGTMLGAVRHHGFIPWDDDIDIGMPRKDFERLKELSDKFQSDRYAFETVRSEDPTYCFAYSKLYDTSTTLIENTRIKLVRGLYIDIFPIDGVGDDLKKAASFYKKLHRKELLLKLRNSPDKADRSKIKNIIIKLVRILPKAIADEKKLSRKIDQICQTYDFDSSSYSGNLVGAWGWREIMPTEFFGTPKLYTFEGISLYGVERYDDFLKQIYGNWQELPSKDKQVSHHDYYIDLSTPYSKYKETNG